MARTITDKLNTIKNCKSEIKNEVNRIYGEDIISDDTTFENYANAISNISEIKERLRNGINEKLKGEITDETKFSDYAKIIEDYEPESKYDMYRATIDEVPGVTVFMEPEDGITTKGSLISVKYILDDGYVFDKWEPTPTFTDSNTSYFTIDSDISIRCQCTYEP